MADSLDFPFLAPVLEALVQKYREVQFDDWEVLYKEDERFNDYSPGAENPEVESDSFWQAHTDVLEVEENEAGRYALVSVCVFPYGVNSIPPAPHATLIVYESGLCEISTPSGRYSHRQDKA